MSFFSTLLVDLQRFTAMTAVCQRLQGCRRPSHHSTLELPLNISTAYLRLTQWHPVPICNSGSGKISVQEEGELYKRSWNRWFRLMCLRKWFSGNNIASEKVQLDAVHLCLCSVCVKNCLTQGKKTLFFKEETRSRTSYLGMFVNYLSGSK